MLINSLWPSDTIWQQRSGSTLAQVMACCLAAPSHYLNQCWLMIKSSDVHISAISQAMPQPSIIQIHLKITYIKFHSNFPGASEMIIIYSHMQRLFTIRYAISLTNIEMKSSEKLKGVYWFNLIHLSACMSVCGQNCVHSVSSILAGSISYLHTLSSNFSRCVVCKVFFTKLKSFKFWKIL